VDRTLAQQRVEERGLQIVQDVLDERMSILDATHGLLALLRMHPAFASQSDFELMRAISSETDDLPIGPVREHWHPAALSEKDGEIQRLESLWREQMLLACERMRRTLLLRKLVLNRHLAVSERQILGVVKRQEVAAIVKSLLLTDTVFPIEGREGVGFEGAFLGQMSSGVRLVSSRSYAENPRAVAERRVDHFQNVDESVEAFINAEWPTGIDGIPLISDH
jgi:hypothetical protein